MYVGYLVWVIESEYSMCAVSVWTVGGGGGGVGEAATTSDISTAVALYCYTVTQ